MRLVTELKQKNLDSRLLLKQAFSQSIKERSISKNISKNTIEGRKLERRTIELRHNGFYINGKPQLLRGGSFQWFKLPKEVWEDRILRFKAAGYNTIDMYVAWKNHEPKQGQFDFKKYDMKHFLDLAKKHNMYVVFRPGPYICNEMDSGGLPGWLIAKSRKDGIDEKNNQGFYNIRTNQKDFIDAVTRYFNKVNEIVKPYLHTNGGPVILYSVENEYDWFQLLKEFDKHSTVNGKPERPIDQHPNIKNYLENLARIVRKAGIDIPITTCPGEGKVLSMGDAKDVMPMPNMYMGLKHAEYHTVNLINDMHSNKYQGLYKNVPAGLTETTRDANAMRRLILGGMNSVLQFNNIGFFQDGYQNAVLINGVLFDSVKGAVETISKMFDYKSPNTGFLRPSIGLYPGKGDYFGSAISPSGVLRDNFYNLRRTNLFIDSFQELIAKSYKPFRTFDSPIFEGQNRSVLIKNNGTGIIDPDKPGVRGNYWLQLGDETALIGIYNDGKSNRNLGKNSVSAFGTVFPKYTNLTVPVENGLPTSSNKNHISTDYEYTMFLPYNFPVSDSVKLNYSTSEVLALKEFNDEKLMVVYGKPNTLGEMRIDGKNVRITSVSEGVVINEKEENSFTISYKHGEPKSISYVDDSGKSGRIIVLDTDMAGKTWFINSKGKNVMISGVDYVDALNNVTNLEFSSSVKNDKVIVYSKSEIKIPDCKEVLKFDLATGLSIFKVNKNIPKDIVKIDISKGKIMPDYEESKPDYDTKGWIDLGDKPKYLETQGIYNGHAWYRAEFTLDKKDLLKNGGLKVDRAGDFEGIYINGHYISTLTSLGTEINSKSRDRGYKFNIPKDILKEGKNTIAFKTEIWGHGGILLPRGTLNRVTINGHSVKIPFIRLRFPSMSYDSNKGLSGDAKFYNKPITNWKLRPCLGGNIKEFHKPGFNDSKWLDMKVPLELKKGEVLWYRTSFNLNEMPDKDKWFAPLALALKGVNSKASIYLNGRLIGRWISDDKWLQKGGWFQPTKNMWTSSSTDEFPIPQSGLRNGKNVISIAFEDTSGNNEKDIPGKITEVKMNIATENIAVNDGKFENRQTVSKRIKI